jgi:hypothetical protein
VGSSVPWKKWPPHPRGERAGQPKWVTGFVPRRVSAQLR